MTHKVPSHEQAHDRETAPQTSGSRTPAIDCLIVTYNNAETIVDTLESLRKQQAVELTIHIIDNSPDSTTYAAITAYDATISCHRTGKNLGFGSAMNYAAQQGTSPWLLLLNPDAWFDNPQALAELVKTSQRTSARLSGAPGIVGPRITYPDGRNYPSGRQFPTLTSGVVHALTSLRPGRGSHSYLHGSQERLDDSVVQVDWISGSAMLVPRELFIQLGGFDTRYFMYAEDMDLCWQVARLGGFAVRDDAVTAVHIAGASSGGGNWRTLTHHHVSIAKFLSKTWPRSHKILLPLLLPALVLRWFVAVLLLTIRK